ncbi:MAG: phosphoribosylglycinamide formyltransferase [Leptospiraceae bacterium]|nr:phosphoribosylglycinamide formyltransferase [Leptospiraceae bacterium]MCP5499833.1 phosphoribosylglycinamide formyltransferase [Leptospiraceae bacterium]
MFFMRKKIVFLSSTRGTNLRAVLNALKTDKIPAKALALITDNPEAGAINIARENGLEVSILAYKQFPNKLLFNESLLTELKKWKPDLIVAAGYLRILPDFIVKEFPNRIINIHPSLLPAFPGLNAVEQALEYGARYVGCTTHFIDSGVDTGPIILQSAVKVADYSDLVSLQMAVQKEEHKILPKSVKLFCEGKIKIEGRKTVLL